MLNILVNVFHEIKAMLRIQIRDPGFRAFLIPGSGIRERKKSESGINISDHIPRAQSVVDPDQRWKNPDP